MSPAASATLLPVPNFTPFGSLPTTADYGVFVTVFTDILSVRYDTSPDRTYVYLDDDVAPWGSGADPAVCDFALTGLYDVSPEAHQFIVSYQHLLQK